MTEFNQICTCEGSSPVLAEGYRSSTKCHCDFILPSERAFRSVAKNAERASALVDLGPSAEGIVDRTLELIFDHWTGKLFQADGREVPILTDPSLTDSVFREDPRRTLNRYLLRATKLHHNRLQKRMIPMVEILWLALSIHECLTSGAHR